MNFPEFTPSQLWGALVRDWQVPFISDSEIESAMESLSKARLGLADESSPTCLVPIGLENRVPFSPVDCSRPADRGSHSIQRAGPLEEISTRLPGGLYVLQLFPDVRHLVKYSKGDSGRVASKWLWEIDTLPPRDDVPISKASVGHFACDDHDRGFP